MSNKEALEIFKALIEGGLAVGLFKKVDAAKKAFESFEVLERLVSGEESKKNKNDLGQ